MITIPEGIDRVTQWLNLTGNNLQTVTREKFKSMGLTHLQRIYLAYCRLQSIDDRALGGLRNLVEIDLSHNYITTIPSEMFQDTPLLMKLVISFNPISVIHREAFRYLPALITLEINDCELNLIEEGAFIGANVLEWIKLDGNRLTTITGKMIFPESLQGITLLRNKWQCDCHMMDLHAFLANFTKLPVNVIVACMGPPRLAGKEIRSIDMADLACLPDVSPTTLYLEIGEGKNLTLQCKVNAVPEAHVFWLFQGQVLQNDTVIEPGLHFYYYIEEGVEDKRSELFIHNTGPEDNGTFTCVAENAAGRAQANYTIRVVLKEDPPPEDTVIPFEYMIAIYAGIVVLAVAVIIVIIVSIVRCKRNRRRKRKKDRTKQAALENQDAAEKSSDREDEEPTVDPMKINGGVMLTEGHHEMVIFSSTNTDDIITALPTASCSTQFRSPPLARIYTTEQNPDLINGTEIISTTSKRREGDGEIALNINGHNNYQEAMESVIEELEAIRSIPVIRQVHWKDMPNYPVRVGSRELCQHTVDVHLNPGCLMEPESYPADYGLPTPIQRPQMPNEHFYRTLPHNRNSKRISAANPMSRYSREAEFLSRTSQQPASFEHYCPPDVRYTADGYPRPLPQDSLYPDTSLSEDHFVPSPPEPYKTDAPSSLPCCTSPMPNIEMKSSSGQVGVVPQWPHCLPVGLHMPSHEDNQSKYATISKRCANAQTDTGVDKPLSRQASLDQGSESGCSGIKIASPQPPVVLPEKEQSTSVRTDTLTESPDEGYEGETPEAAAI